MNLPQMFSDVIFSEEGKGIKLSNGWTFSKTFNSFQKVNNKVYVYVSPKFGGFKAQMYQRKDVTMCGLEAQIDGKVAELLSSIILNPNLDKNITKEEMVEVLEKSDLTELENLFAVAQIWLDKFGDGIEGMEDDLFYAFSGFWSYKLLKERGSEYLE